MCCSPAVLCSTTAAAAAPAAAADAAAADVAAAAPAAPGQDDIALAIWSLNVLLFLLFSCLMLCRALLFSSTLRHLYHHSNQSLFVGAIPMAFSTITNGVIAFLMPRWGWQAGLWMLQSVGQAATHKLAEASYSNCSCSAGACCLSQAGRQEGAAAWGDSLLSLLLLLLLLHVCVRTKARAHCSSGCRSPLLGQPARGMSVYRADTFQHVHGARPCAGQHDCAVAAACRAGLCGSQHGWHCCAGCSGSFNRHNDRIHR